MELNIKQTIAVLVVVILAVSCLIPVVNEFSQEQDIDRYGGPIGKYATDDLDGWTLDVRKASTGYRIASSMYTGTMTKTGMILSTDGVTIWTDVNHIYTMIGGTVTVRTELSAIIEGGVLTVNDETVPVTGTIYVLSDLGEYGTYSGNAHSQPVSGIGTYASVAISSIGDDVTGNSSDYVLVPSVTDNRLEFLPGTYEPPVQVPPRQQAQIKPGLDLDVIEDPEIFEREEFGTIEKGEITIIPGKGEIIGGIDMEDVIVTPGKLPSGTQAVGDATSGTTGQCTWELDGDTLYIRGNGQTADYTYNFAQPEAPWPLSITHLVVEEGVTRIGTAAFLRCDLETVELPSTLTSIKNHAFRYCYNLKEMNIPASLTELASNCLASTAIQQLILPDSFTIFGVNCIFNCNSLTELYIPATLTSPGSQTAASFTDIDGTNTGVTPRSGVYYTGPGGMVFYETVEDDVGDYGYQLTYIDARLTRAANVADVMVPYTVEYDGRTVPVTGIQDGAVSGSSVRSVVIPQTVESVSPTAITGPGIKEILNLSAAEVTASHGEVRTSVPALAVISDHVTRDWYGQTVNLLYVVPLILVAGAVLAIVRGFAWGRYD